MNGLIGLIQQAVVHMVDVIKGNNYYPNIQVVSSLCSSTVGLEGTSGEIVNFASNSYLDLGQHPKVIEAGIKALRTFGAGSGGSRLTAGSQSPHRQLEERLARFKGSEAAIIFSVGYLANTGIIPALTGATLKGVLQILGADESSQSMEIIFDELVHASIIDGLAVSNSRIFRGNLKMRKFNNRDMADLEKVLKTSTAVKKLIVTDGIFSLHGRLAPLDQICALAKKYNAEVYVDDAHGFGVFGETGLGVAEHFGVDKEIDFPVGTLSKAVGCCGGYITGSAEFCDYLRVAARPYMFQTSIAPAVAACTIAALDVMHEEPERRQNVLSKSAMIRSELESMGFDILGSQTQIIPVCFRTSSAAKKAAEMLFEKGIFAPPYYYPAVPDNEGMVRVNITCGHTYDQINSFLEKIQVIGKDLGVI